MILETVYSRPTTDSILKFIGANFPEIHFEECNFYVRGLHDTYLLKSSASKNNVSQYILRLYRTQWRSEEAIRFELDVLSFIAKKGGNVSAPILNKQLEHLLEYSAPESRRFASLFTFADGEAPDNNLVPQSVQLLGKSVAKIHLALDNFQSKYSRVELNSSELIDASIAHISSYVDESKRTYLKAVGEKITEKLSILNKENANFGVVTGDINFTNFHLNEDKKITHFDFDQCGYAYRVFEVGKFSSFIAPMENKKELLDAFLKGYSEHIKLSATELSMIPVFEMASVIWVMAIAAQNETLIGYKYLEGGFWDQRISRLDKLVKDHF